MKKVLWIQIHCILIRIMKFSPILIGIMKISPNFDPNWIRIWIQAFSHNSEKCKIMFLKQFILIVRFIFIFIIYMPYAESSELRWWIFVFHLHNGTFTFLNTLMYISFMLVSSSLKIHSRVLSSKLGALDKVPVRISVPNFRYTLK